MLDPNTNPSIKLAGKGRQRFLLLVTAGAADFIAITIAFAIACIIRLGEFYASQLYNLLIVTLPIYFGFAINNRAYSVSALNKIGTSFQRSAISLIFAVVSVLLVAFFLKASEDFSRLIFGMGVIGSFALIALGRLGVRYICWKTLGRNPMSELVICDGADYLDSDKTEFMDAKAYGIHPNPKDPLNVQRLGMVVQDMDRVIVHCKPEFRDDWAHALKALDVNGEIVVPELTALAPLSLNRRDSHISLAVSIAPLKWHQRAIKRAFDIVIAGVGLASLAIPMAIVALLIKMNSPGPILFKQKRIGLGSRPFSILKFRSMQAEKTDADGDLSTQRDDSRVTALGNFIRRTSIDELPQLFNVLSGDMSIVGPRPHAVGSTAEDKLFWDIDRRYWHRHTIKPGLTGLAQVRGFRGATEKAADLEGRLQSDLEYRSEWSLWGDIKIVLLTFRVLMHKNAF
ncbi:MAG: exopolysaccharide biosynthesis polyprenyl glycosylphosphotransferase [Sphingorhabdus sp.]